jgi:hypothetical protein
MGWYGDDIKRPPPLFFNIAQKRIKMGTGNIALKVMPLRPWLPLCLALLLKQCQSASHKIISHSNPTMCIHYAFHLRFDVSVLGSCVRPTLPGNQLLWQWSGAFPIVHQSASASKSEPFNLCSAVGPGCPKLVPGLQSELPRPMKGRGRGLVHSIFVPSSLKLHITHRLRWPVSFMCTHKILIKYTTQ